MASQQLIPLNIVIADRNYRIKILPADEETVRKVLKTINEKILEFKTQFAGKDMQDYVSMVLLWYATEQQKPTPTEIYNTSSQEKLNKIEELLNKTLSAK